MTSEQKEYFKKALQEACMDDEDVINDCTDDIEVSDKFMNKMKKLIQSEKHPKLIIFNSVFKRIATVAVLMAVCISALFATNSITADREPEFYFYIGDDPRNDGMTMLRFYESVADLAPNEILDYYTPDYIPRGYKIHQVHTGSCVRIDYTNEADDLIRFSQYTAQGTIWYRDDNVENEYIEINGNAGVYFYTPPPPPPPPIWSNGNYFFHICGPCSKEELVKMAESFKLDENFEEKLIEMIKNGEVKR